MIDSLKLDLKTVIAIVMYVGSLLGVYFKMQNDVDNLKQELSEYKKLNPDLILYRIQTIETNVNQINDKADNIERILSQ